MISRWNTDGYYTVELIAPDYCDSDIWTTVGDDIPQELDIALRQLLPDEKESSELFELEVHFSSKGYYDPGKTYGPPEKCYPPEGDDERDIIATTIYKNGKAILSLPVELHGCIWSKWENEIMDVEVDTTPDYPDDERDDYE